MSVSAPQVVELTDQNFDAGLSAVAAGLLFVHKPLCPNCKALGKLIERFLKANPGLSYVRLDSQSSPTSAARLGAVRIPMVCVIRNGQIVASRIGLMNMGEMTRFVGSA